MPEHLMDQAVTGLDALAKLPPSRPTISAAASRVARAPGVGLIGFLALLLAGAGLVYPGFYQAANLQNVLSQNAPIGLVAIGMTFVMICGGFDLSVGSIAAMSSVVYAKLALDVPLYAALVAALTLGIVLGLGNGLLVTKWGINPFIATLATSSIFSGAAYVLSDSQPIVVDLPGFDWLGQGTVLGVPVSVVILVLVLVAAGLVLAYSVFGHSVYATGGNREAARLAGLRVDVIRTSTYVLVGMLAALAGLLLTSRLGVGQADVGADMTLNAITIVVIGGTSLFGGEGAIWRTAVGLLLLGIITNVADSRGWNGSVQDIVKGAILLGAVGLDVLSRRLRVRKVVQTQDRPDPYVVVPDGPTG
jgi:ribose transport system permease protein